MSDQENCNAGQTLAASGLLGHFAVRLYAAPAPGQIGPQDRPHVVYAKSLAAAKRAAKALAGSNGWRLIEVFALLPEERDEFRRAGWYVNTLTA